MSKVLVFTDFGGPENQELIEREVPRRQAAIALPR